MAGIKKEYIPRKHHIWSLLITITLLSFYFIYFFLRINTKLIYQSQEPVFFFDTYFLRDFFNSPGGINDLLSRFLSQFFYYSWTGALLLVLVFWLIAWNSKLLIQSIRQRQSIFYLSWIPSIFLLALHSDYRHPLALTLGLLWALLGVNIYIRLAPTNQILRFLFYIFFNIVLYYITAGPALLFSIVIALYDMVSYRRILFPFLCIVFAFLLPYLGSQSIFLIYFKDAYTKYLVLDATYKVRWLLWGLYSFFPFVLLWIAVENRFIHHWQNSTKRLSKFLYHRSSRNLITQGVIIVLLIIISAMYSYDKVTKTILLVNHYAQSKEWEKVIKEARTGFHYSYVVQSQVSRTLYHSGRLCDELFSFPQRSGIFGLFLHPSLRPVYALSHSDVFFDLGLVNESEHWAYEAVSVKGETPWNLQRLVLVNLLEENQNIAAKYLDKVEKTMWHSAWAKKHKKFLSENGDSLSFSEFQYLKGSLPKSDFLVSPTEPERCLESLIENTKNKMAFEYFMAYCLLEGKIDLFIKNVYRMNYFDYPKIPRHFEEAILVYIQLTGREDIVLPGRKVSQETIRRFMNFNQILDNHNRNRAEAYRELEKYFKDTYWFYALYYYNPEEY